MKKFISKQKNCGITMLILIAICEILLRVDNRIIQSLGIFMLPFILFFGFLLIKNDALNIKNR